MKLRILSDAHTECYNYNKFKKTLDKVLPPLPSDSESVLVCAGDIGTYKYYTSTYKPFFAETSKRFKKVVVVPGNHSWYNSTGIWGNEKEFWADKKLPENVHYLDNAYCIHEHVMFIGSCLWTSFNNADSLAMWHASKKMNDFETIRKSGGIYGTSIKLQPEDTVERHRNSVEFIRIALLLCGEMGLTPVVVTHHAPSSLSVHEKYRGDLLNTAYYTDLSDLILDHSPKYWIHGHTHDSFDYEIGDTRIIVNPFGYKDYEENKRYNPELVVEVQSANQER